MALPSSWIFWALFSAVFAALTAIFAKTGVEGVDSDMATFFRTCVVAVALMILMTATGKWRMTQSLSPKTYLFLTLSGLATGASWLCYFRALQMGEAARVAPIDKLSVVFVAVFATLFLGERLTSYNWLGVLLIGAGAILVAYKN